MHQKLQNQLALFDCQIDGFYFCPHTPDDHCKCRKPKTGLLEQLSKDINNDLRGSPFVGDSKRDLDAAARFGAEPVLVKTGNGNKTLTQLENPNTINVFDSLKHFSDHILHNLE